jgi:hypothetical protein
VTRFERCWSVCLVFFLGVVAPAMAFGGMARIYTAPVKDVIKHANLVVRGHFLPGTGRLTVESVLLGSLGEARIHVHNARILPRAVRAQEKGFDAILLLRSFDDRFYLPVSSSPDWVSPHAAIKKVCDDGMLMGLMQVMSGPPVWHKAGRSIRQLTEDLAGWKETKRFASEATLPQMLRLRPKDLDRFYKAIEPELDFYTQKVKTSAYNIPRFCARVSKLMRGKMPALTLRAVQAMLYFGNQTGSPQPRREAAEKALIDLVKERGHQWILPVLMDELSSLDPRSNKRSAARVMRAIGGKHALRARDALVRLRARSKAEGRKHLATPIHFALVYLGYDPDKE